MASVAVSLTVVYTEFDDFTTRHTTDRELRLVRQAGLQHIAAGGGGSRRNTAVTFDMEKLEWRGYPTVKNI